MAPVLGSAQPAYPACPLNRGNLSPKEAAKNAGAEELKAVRQAAERESEGNSVQGEFWASFAGTENAKREQPVAENPVGRDPALGPVLRRILHGLTDELIAKS
jgi:hypothetical protein